MNIINVKVNFTKGTCETTGINLITGDYNSTKIVFEFDREDGTKVFEMKSPSEELVMVKEIQNNEIPLYALDENENVASLFSEDGYYVFEISLYNEGSKLTSVSSKLRVKPEQVVIDDEVVTPYLPVFDELMQDVEIALGNIEDKITEVNTAITQTNNLDLDVSKSGKVATVTLTKKDNTTKTVTLSDGTSLQFNWDGTKLGVKTDNDESYTYVDLKGETGETGATPSLSIGTVSTGSPSAVTITGTDENPVLNFTLEKGETGATGATGNGIASIVKTSTSGTVDTYTITYTDGTTTTFNVTNGEVSQAQLDELQAQVDYYKTTLNALPKITGTGTELTLNNTANAPMTIDLEPNTSQETTTGKNLLPNTNTTQTINYVTFTKNNDGSITINGTATSQTIYRINVVGDEITLNNGTYTFSTKNNLTTNVTVQGWYGSGNNFIEFSSGSNKQTVDVNNTYSNVRFQIVISSGTTVSNLTIYPQLESGSTATSYEPYTGSIPAPNPDYPQQVHVVSGDNTVKVGNKNLFDGIYYNTYTSGGAPHMYRNDNPDVRSGIIKVQPNTTYTISKELSSRFRISEYNEYPIANASYATSYIYPNQDDSLTVYTVTTGATTQYLVVQVTNDAQENVRMQVEKGSATTYVPHQEQTAQLNLGDLEYCKIPNSDYKDEFMKPSGKNLFDKSTITPNKYIDNSGNLINENNNFTGDYIEIDNTKSYYLSASTTQPKRIVYYNSSKTFISRQLLQAVHGGTITIPANTKYVRLSCYNVDLDSLMLNEGTTALPYEPYGTGWYLKKNIGKVVLDGSEDWTRVNYETSNNWVQFRLDLSNSEAIQNPLSNYFKGENYVTIYNQKLEAITIDNSSRIRISFDNLDISTVELFKTWLSTHNTIVYYVLETPQYILLPNNLQEAFNTLESKLLAYKDQTNITQVNNDLPFEIVTSALKDISNL